MAQGKQVSVRLPSDVAEQIALRGPTTPFIVEAVREKLERLHRAEIEASLQCLAGDPDANDFSDWAPLQQEVMARVD